MGGRGGAGRGWRGGGGGGGTGPSGAWCLGSGWWRAIRCCIAVGARAYRACTLWARRRRPHVTSPHPLLRLCCPTGPCPSARRTPSAPPPTHTQTHAHTRRHSRARTHARTHTDKCQWACTCRVARRPPTCCHTTMGGKGDDDAGGAGCCCGGGGGAGAPPRIDASGSCSVARRGTGVRVKVAQQRGEQRAWRW